MLKSTLEQLEEVQAAITAVLANQSYRLGDRQVTRADLEFLTAREEILLRRYNEEAGTRPSSLAVDFAGLGYE